MATLQHNRATYQHVNGNIRVGSRKPVATATETANIRKAIKHLQDAVNATNDTTMLVNLSSAFQLTRTIILARK